MRGRKSPLVVTLTGSERYELESWLRCRNMRAGLVCRARAVLLVADGKSITETSCLVGLARKMVRRWVSRFIKKRVLGLGDKAGRGRKPVFFPGSDVTPCKISLRDAG